ncbi:MAG: hypothetical protein ACPLRH_06100 [Desulfotomaculales bacterium]
MSGQEFSEQEFIKFFSRQKEAFLQEHGESSFQKVLNWFERWLQEEREAAGEEGTTAGDEGQVDFDAFLEAVVDKTRELLDVWGVEVGFPSPGKWLGLKAAWRCLRVLDNKNVFYRVGKTRPRKGTRQNQDLLVLDLVMDGQKKQVFQPLLQRKKEIEEELGEVLERELPKVEATGKYRLKLFLPFRLVECRDIETTAKKLASFILATKKALNKIGVV